MNGFLLDDDGDTAAMPQHQHVNILCVEDTIETLSRLHERIQETQKSRSSKKTKKTKRRIKKLKSLSLALALVDPTSATKESLVAMCEAVTRCFPGLHELEIHSEMDPAMDPNALLYDPAALPQIDPSLAVPVECLAVLLHPKKGLKKLRELTLHSIHFDSNDETMRVIAKAISRHPYLQRSYLYDTSMTNLSTGRSGMEKLVTALGRRVSKLVIVGCRLAPPVSYENGVAVAPSWAGSCLVKVCQSTTLQEFKLHNLEQLREEHIVLMSQALVENRSLKKLSILKMQELADFQHHPDNIKFKHLQQQQVQEETLSSDAGTLALANMLRRNTTLEELCVNAVDFNEYSAMFFGNALVHDNTTLTDIWLMIPSLNGGTSSFPVDDRRIAYYLRLNRAGRQSFAASSNKQSQSEGQHHRDQKSEWIKSLIQSRWDINCTFYKLRCKPCLCDASSDPQHHACDHPTPPPAIFA